MISFAPEGSMLETHHPGGNPGANLKSFSHRCHPILVAFVWELTKETIDLPLGCLQGGIQGHPVRLWATPKGPQHRVSVYGLVFSIECARLRHSGSLFASCRCCLPWNLCSLAGRCKATWKKEFKLPRREAGPPNPHDATRTLSLSLQLDVARGHGEAVLRVLFVLGENCG